MCILLALAAKREVGGEKMWSSGHVAARTRCGMLEAKEEQMSAVLPLPPSKVITPDDLLRMPDQGQGFELVNGELKERKVSTLSHLVAGEVYFHLRSHVGPNKLG